MNHLISIDSIPKISAIYYALLQCGYDYYAVGKDKSLAARIETFRKAEEHSVPDFFHQVRQRTCDIYPYWPRAALLESAVFFTAPDSSGFQDFDSYKEMVMAAGNISDAERDEAFWEWMEGFPAALKAVLDSKPFQAYYEWECSWINQQNHLLKEELQHTQQALALIKQRCSSPVKAVSVVLNPIKCASSADYPATGTTFIVCTGSFSPKAVIHEFLHQIVHPLMPKYLSEVSSHLPYPNVDKSYYLTGDAYGKLNAFEEYIVQSLTELAAALNLPADIDSYISETSKSSSGL